MSTKNMDNTSISKAVPISVFRNNEKSSEEHFKCPKCGCPFPSYSEVAVHLKLIHNACTTPNCKKISDFELHSSVCINRGFDCVICNKKFSDELLLFQHFNEHIDAAFYACEVCRDGFQQWKDLQKHLLYYHNKNIPLPVAPTYPKELYQKCNFCSKYFRLFAEFGEHVSSCKADTSAYACCICRVVFSTISDLDQHKLIEHKSNCAVNGYLALKQGKRYFCGICYLGFFKGGNLKKHLVTHKMDESYICDVCHLNFVCDDELQLHYLQHIEEHYILHDLIRQHSCCLCLKTFKTKKELNDHLMLKVCKNNNSPSDHLPVPNVKHMTPVIEKEQKSNALQDVLEPALNIPIDTSEILVYMLKSGEELLNCDDCKCVVIMNLASLFVLQRGICASENRMPDVKGSEVYDENEVADASVLENYMLQIFSECNNTNNLPNSEESGCNLQNNKDTSCSEQNYATSSEHTNTVNINFDESNVESAGCVNSDKIDEYLVPECLISDNKESSFNNQIEAEIPNKEFALADDSDEMSLCDLFVCNICQQVFNSQDSLCLHLKGAHDCSYCYHCKSLFNSDDELKNHEKIYHRGLFQCDLCELSYFNKCLLEKHKYTEHDSKLLNSENECCVNYKQEETSSNKCEICGKIYANINQYTRHKALHNSKNPIKKYQCHICDKAFYTRVPFKTHLKTHVKKFPFSFECPVCKMKFPLKLLDKHIDSHYFVL